MNATRPSLFTPRHTIKPREYPEAMEYAHAIHKSFWTHDHFKDAFSRDVQDFHTKLSPCEKSVITRTLLAISQVEVKVKKFWSKLDDVFQKPEFFAVGACFADCEVRHAETYSHLLGLLGLDEEFNHLLEVPAIKARIEYMNRHLSNGGSSSDPRRYTTTLTFFSLFVENVSLFSQFAIIKSFFKHRGTMRGVDNAVQATQKEELVHGLFGTYLVNLVREEQPDWFDADFYSQLRQAALDSYAAEGMILDWIFEKGELEFIPRSDLDMFLKNRFNDSLTPIGAAPAFPDAIPSENLKWFEEEIHAQTQMDFFHKRPTSYTRGRVSAADLFN